MELFQWAKRYIKINFAPMGYDDGLLEVLSRRGVRHTVRRPFVFGSRT